MRDHIKILGILTIVMGSLTALLGVGVLLAMGTVGGFIASSLVNSMDYQDRAVTGSLVAGIGLAIAIFFFVLGVPSILGGWGLLNFRPWSRPLMIVVSILNLFHIPIGTLLGVYGMYVLFSDEGRQILESGGAFINAPAAPAYYGARGNFGPPPPPPPAPSV